MFIHLHNHSHYSLLDGLPKIKDYVSKCLEYEMPGMALTDHGVMYGAIEFYKKMKDAGLNPIIGMEAYVAPRRLIFKKPKLDDKPFHLLLLAKDLQGYKNLIELSTIGQVDGFYYKPRIDKEVLAKYSKGLIASSACMAGEINRALEANDFDLAERATHEYQNIFGKENFYLEYVYLGEGVKGQTEHFGKIVDLSKKTACPMIITKDAHYIEKEDAIAQDALICVNTGTTLDNPKRLSLMEFDCSFTPPKEIEELFKDYPEAIENTKKIHDACHVELELGKWTFPNIELPAGKTADETLRDLTFKKFKEMYPDEPKVYHDRIEYELEIIATKGYSTYFLVVSDLISWARSQDIVVTTRGSGAGSLVGYLIEISSIDPIYFKLPFERFLNPLRPSPPDVDMDFADNRRHEVVDYARRKYGDDKVAQICTFGTMMARGSVRDITRVLGFEYDFGDRLAKMIPMEAKITIQDAIDINPELKMEYEHNQDAKKVLDLAMKIEGCARHSSIHAAGTLIAPSKITDFLPLQRDPSKRKKITQYEMHASEDSGLLKYDFLGIANLSIMGEAVKIIERTKDVKVDILKIPFDDPRTFELLASGNTMGVFQLSSAGMTKWLVELKPTTIEDIMAMVALYRPGPMDFIPEYIERAHDHSKIDYPHEKLRDILGKSLGLLIYQDDVMLTAIELAGYDWLEADKFRKAMGKKVPELMAEQENKFKDGCVTNGIKKETADDLWERIKPFATYAFNKAHAASYGAVAYQTAYLKANYPAEYLTALLTVESDDEEKVANTIQEAERMGIKVLQPDVNHSRKDFTYVSDTEIRFGLLAIKNLGSDIIVSIYNERKKNGPYKDLADLLNRVESKNLNKKSIEALAKAGALDAFGERNQIVANIDQILAYIKTVRTEKNTNQASLFSFSNDGATKKENEVIPLNLKPVPPVKLSQKLAWEKELLGIYLTGHPFSEFAHLLAGKVRQLGQIKELRSEQKLIASGIIIATRKIFTKNNDPMMFVTIEDIGDNIEIVVFPKVYEVTKDLWIEGQAVVVTGRLSLNRDKPNILADNVWHIDTDNLETILAEAKTSLEKKKRGWNGGDGSSNGGGYSNGNNGGGHNTSNSNTSTPAQSIQKTVAEPEPDKPTIGQVLVRITQKINNDIHENLKKIFEANNGPHPVYIYINQKTGVRKIETNFKIDYNESVKKELEEIVGEDNVRIG